ncbi:MAG: hypothetical protein ACP5JR_00795, partial [Thermoplasmata archaeon]
MRKFVFAGRKASIIGRTLAIFSVLILVMTVFNMPAHAENEKLEEKRTGKFEIYTDTLISDSTHITNQSVVVHTGAELQIINSTLVFQADAGVPHNQTLEFIVEYGATLRVMHSQIRGNNTTYKFVVNGMLECENSTILDTWNGTQSGGLILNTKSAIIRNSTIGCTNIGLYLPSMGNRTLLVNSDLSGNDYGKKFYSVILSSIGTGFDYWDVFSQGLPLNLRNYSAVLWFTGSGENGTLNETAANLLSDYLNSSGNLLLTGQGIGRDAGNSYLYRTQLNVTYGGHESGREIFGKGFLSNLSFELDAVYPLHHGYIITHPDNVVLAYADGRAAAIAVASNYRVFYTEFSIECLGMESAGNLLEEVMKWFEIFTLCPEKTIFYENFEKFNESTWWFEDLTGNGTWGISDYNTIGEKSLWCAGNASRDAESIAFYEDFENFSTSLSDIESYSGSDGFGISDRRSADGTRSLWCAGSGEQWEEQGCVVLYEDFTEFKLKSYDENRGSGIDFWGSVNGRAWCAGAGDSMAIMNLRAGKYDNLMNSTMLLPLSIPYNFATLAFELELQVASGDYLEVGYLIGSKTYMLEKYTTSFTGIERFYLPKFADTVYFRFVSDEMNVDGGAYIDNIEVRAYNYTTYLYSNFYSGLEGWFSYDNNPLGGNDTWGIVTHNGYEVWCAAQGSQSNAFENTYTPIFSEGFDYGLVNWQTNGTGEWTLSTRNLSAPYSAFCTHTTDNGVFPLVSVIETQFDARDTGSQKFEFDMIFEKNDVRSTFSVDVLVEGQWQRVYTVDTASQRWAHHIFVSALNFTAFRFVLTGKGSVYVDNVEVAVVKSIPNTLARRYDAGMNSSLQLSINLSGWDQIHLSYRIWYDICEKDALYLEVNTGEWSALKKYEGGLNYGKITEDVLIPVNASALRFRFVSDGKNEGIGAFISNIWIYGMHSVSNAELGRIDHGMHTIVEFPVNLSGYNTAFLSYNMFLDIMPYQGVRVSVENATTCSEIANYTKGFARKFNDELSSKWLSQKFDLTQYAGENIRIRFEFISPHYGELTEGFYLDAIKVSGTTKKFYCSGMDGIAGFNVSLTDIMHPYLEFTYFADLENASFRVVCASGGTRDIIFETSSSSEWKHIVIGLDDYVNCEISIGFEFLSNISVGGGVYLDEIKITGTHTHQEGDFEIENLTIYAKDCGLIAEERIFTVHNLQVSGRIGIHMVNSHLAAYNLRINEVEHDALLVNSTLLAFNCNLNPSAIACDSRSSVYANNTIEVMMEESRQGIMPEGNDNFGNPLLFIQKNNSAVANPWYFVKTGNDLTWYAPYTLKTPDGTLKLIAPPVTLPVISLDIDRDGLSNSRENSKNVIWDNASNYQNSMVFSDPNATKYGVNWTFNMNKTNNAVKPTSSEPIFQKREQESDVPIKSPSENLPNGTYRVMLRARSTDNNTNRLVVKANGNDVLNTTLTQNY